MKTVLKYAAVVAVCLLAMNVVSVAASKNPSQVSKLPHTAQQFVKKHFSKCNVIDVSKKKSITSTSYEARCSNGYVLKFDKNGQWTSVDCRRDAVPDGVVPSKVRDYVKKNFKRDGKICRIAKQRNGYEVELTNGLKVDMSKNGGVKKVR